MLGAGCSVGMGAAVFAILQLLYQLIPACITPDSADGYKALAWIHLITHWLGFILQAAVLGAMIWQFLVVRSAADEMT